MQIVCYKLTAKGGIEIIDRDGFVRIENVSMDGDAIVVDLTRDDIARLHEWMTVWLEKTENVNAHRHKQLAKTFRRP